MGLFPFAFVIALLAAAPQPSAAEPVNQQPFDQQPVNQQPVDQQPVSEESFQQLLITADLPELREACIEAASFALAERQQLLRDRLLEIHPRPESLDLVLANAEALLVCRSGDGARVVLSRYIPGDADERRRWLLMSWQAADAALDHPRAALALRRLVNGNIAALDREQLPKAGAFVASETRVGVNGLDQLATHEAHAGDVVSAASVLLSGQASGAVAARRLGRAAELLAETDAERADQLLELALEQVVGDEAWGLAVELLRLQLRLQLAAGGDGERPRQRLERLTARLDDGYSVWSLQGSGEPDPSLRSPREPGGHAAVEDSPAQPSP